MVSRQRRTNNRNSVSKEKLYKFEFSELEWTHEISDCPAYCPKAEEFEDPFNYLQKIAPVASKYGICKIISPLKASVSAADVLNKDKQSLVFGTYVQPLRLPKWNANDKGVFSKGRRKYTYDTFKSMATKFFSCQSPRLGPLPPSYLEKKFWLEMTRGMEGKVEYGVNIEGTAFSSDPNDQLGISKWNLKTLPRLPKSTLRLLASIPGVTDPMLYIGMLYSIFAWHVEDQYLYSINYHHSGAPKTWYGVPQCEANQFEKVVLDHVYDHSILSIVGEDGAFEEIAKKTTIFPPKILLENGVSVYKTVQKAGEFVVTFPRVYHAGFSNGFNCGEAVNFAMADWFPFGDAAGKRYALLRKSEILSYEELLFKEALILYGNLRRHEALDNSTADLACSVKASFLHHIRSLNTSLRCFNNLKMPFSYFSNSEETIVCYPCKRRCYLAFIKCKSCERNMCLFHEFGSRKCSCGGNQTVFLREDVLEVEQAAKMFEEEEVQSQYVNIISCIEEGLGRASKKRK